jgi:hypothetical protein
MLILGVGFSQFNLYHDPANYLALQEWILFGDPSLKVEEYF